MLTGRARRKGGGRVEDLEARGEPEPRAGGVAGPGGPRAGERSRVVRRHVGGGQAEAEAEQVGGLQRPLLQRPPSRQGSLPDRAAGDQDDQQHAQGLVDQDRDLLLRPPAGRTRAGGGPPSRGAGADAPQRPLGDARHEGGARRDRQEPRQGQLHLQVQAELPGSGQRVQQPAHEVLPVQPGREVRGRPGGGLGQHDAQRRRPPVERPLLHRRRPRDVPPVRGPLQGHVQGLRHPSGAVVLLRHPDRPGVRRLGRQAHGRRVPAGLAAEGRPGGPRCSTGSSA